jgi:hypothetical protein
MNRHGEPRPSLAWTLHGVLSITRTSVLRFDADEYGEGDLADLPKEPLHQLRYSLSHTKDTFDSAWFSLERKVWPAASGSLPAWGTDPADEPGDSGCGDLSHCSCRRKAILLSQVKPAISEACEYRRNEYAIVERSDVGCSVISTGLWGWLQ